MGNEIKLLITDFDGTLASTFKANYMAYSKAFQEVGFFLSEADYRNYFGYRFDEFIKLAGIEHDEAQKIKKRKQQLYSSFFHLIKVNHTLINLLKAFHDGGRKTALATTARRQNLENALNYIGALHIFDYIIAGEEVNEGKPSPEIYLKTIHHFNVQPSETLVFEDSEAGIQSAQAAGINYIIINELFYGN